VSEAAAHPIQYLIDRKLDLAIIPRTIHDRQIALEPLFQDKLVAIVHPEHPLARKKYLTAGDFANEHLFLYSERERIEDWTFYGTILKPSGVTPRQITYIALTEGIIEMVKAGLGIAVFAHWAVDPELKRHSIKALPITRKGFIRQWNAAFLKNNSVHPQMDSFIKMLANRRMPAMKYY
jgi:LysR family transcriptional regulator for metE and metH